MIKHKYKKIDCSTNIIITLKNNNFTEFKPKRTSYKKIEPIHVKMFDRNKNSKVLSRNDRLDLFLEGDQVKESKKVSSKSLLTHKKGDTNSLANKYESQFWGSSKTTEDEGNKTKYLQRKSERNVMKSKTPSHIDAKVQWKKYSSIKKQLLKVTSQEKTKTIPIPKKKPLFYLESKEIHYIKAQSFIVTQYPSGNIVFGNYFKKNAEIASLTKIMTFFAVHQIVKRFQKKIDEEFVQIDEESSDITGTSAELCVGDIYTVEQLLYGLMLPSGNDAATALAKWGGKLLISQQEKKNQQPVKKFVQYMNSMAKKLQMKSTIFGNPHGLPHPQSGSNPEDISILIHECLKIPIFREIVKKKKYSGWIKSNLGQKREVVWENTNKLLRRNNFIGVKTGVTVTAGPCLATCYEAGDKIFIIVLLRTNKLSRRFKETRWILALALTKLNNSLYMEHIRKILKEDPDLDSDNSEDEEEFKFDRSDAMELRKRNKILTFEL